MDYLVKFDSLPWRSPIPGVREKRFVAEGRVLRLVEYEQSMEPHWCARGHIGQIVDGTIVFEFANQVVTAGPGDAVFIPAGPEHAHRATVRSKTATALFVEDVTTPRT